DPMDRSVEVRARVLAEMERVPIPARTLVVVLGDHLDRHPRRGGELRRQADHRRVRSEGLREIDDADAAGVELGHELLEDAHRRSPSRFPSRWAALPASASRRKWRSNWKRL